MFFCGLTFVCAHRIVKSFAAGGTPTGLPKGPNRSLMTRVRLCFHDRCFDGTASAGLFYRFYRERFHADADFHFTGMTHRAGKPWGSGLFDGDENVIVDFKDSKWPKVTWWL